MATVNPYNGDYFRLVGNSILDSAVNALRCAGLEIPERVFLGFDRPPQEWCPELVAWISNIRPYDADFPDGRSNTRLLCINGWAFDITLRIGRCYIDSDENGQAIDSDTLAKWAAELYKDSTALYLGWLYQWRAGEVVELNQFEAVTMGPCTPYNQGGSAGWEFTITVGTI